METGLIIVGGKFYRNGVEEKPEIGNLEQIKVLKEYNKRAEELNGGIEVNLRYDIEVTGFASFNCICGNSLYHSRECNNEDDIDCFDKRMVMCRNCRRSYIFNITDDGKLVAKLH